VDTLWQKGKEDSVLCSALWQSGKEDVGALWHKGKERWIGGCMCGDMWCKAESPRNLAVKGWIDGHDALRR